MYSIHFASIVNKHVNHYFISMCTASEAFNWYVLWSPSLPMKEQDESEICLHNTLNIQGDKRNYFLILP